MAFRLFLSASGCSRLLPPVDISPDILVVFIVEVATCLFSLARTLTLSFSRDDECLLSLPSLVQFLSPEFERGLPEHGDPAELASSGDDFLRKLIPNLGIFHCTNNADTLY